MSGGLEWAYNREKELKQEERDRIKEKIIKKIIEDIDEDKFAMAEWIYNKIIKDD